MENFPALQKVDHSNICAGYLPPTMGNERLIKLLSSFGRKIKAKAIRDHVKGSSKFKFYIKQT